MLKLLPMRLFSCVTLALASNACFTNHTNAEHFVVDDTGFACAFADAPDNADPPQTFMEGKPIAFQATLEQCLFACSQNLEASCSVARSGMTLHISSHGSWTERHALNTACVDSCLVLDATCSTGPLEAGVYTIDYAGKTLPLIIPSAASRPPCTQRP